MKKMGLYVGILLSFSTLTAFPSPDSTGFQESRLNDRVLLLHRAPWAETLTVADAGPGLIVVDTWGSPAAAKKGRARIDSLFHKPVLFVINTHHHWDHTFGNGAFAGGSAKIIGHRFCASDMRASYADPAIRKSKLKESGSLADYASIRSYVRGVEAETAGDGFRLRPPDHPVGDRDTLHVGDLTVLFFHTPGIHTRSNLTVFVPELGIVFGRREFAGNGPISLERGADTAKIVRVLEDILTSGKPVRYLIPGHGQPVADPDVKAGIKQLKVLDNN
jgi:glyoxylase-like metal-dependent hydrolase (beta-lactamase superfamily II)